MCERPRDAWLRQVHWARRGAEWEGCTALWKQGVAEVVWGHGGARAAMLKLIISEAVVLTKAQLVLLLVRCTWLW